MKNISCKSRTQGTLQRTLIQSLFLPFRTYSPSGCFRIKPSPLAPITTSIRSRTSLAVLPWYSVTNSIRPCFSVKQVRRLRFRNLHDLWMRDWPFRYSKSKTLTSLKVNTRSSEELEMQTARAGIVLLLRPIYTRVQSGICKGGRSDIPKAAVFRVPNGRFLPDIGSQTSISPSRIILSRCQRGNAWCGMTYSSTLGSKAEAMKGVKLPAPTWPP